MPIVDLDGRYRPQRLGKVRLGRTEERKIKGKIHKIPYATEFFVMDDMPEAIREEYGEEPTTLRIEFLFNLIEQVFPHYHKFHIRRGLRCMGDGQIVLYRAAGTVEEPMVCIKNGVIVPTSSIPNEVIEEWEVEYGGVEAAGNSLRCLGFECPSSKPGYCRPRGRLCFAVQGHEALGYYEMGTGSINAIAGIVGQFQLANRIFGHIDAIPWNLHLRPETVQHEGKSRKIYVPWIEIDPGWLQRHFQPQVRAQHLRAVEGEHRADIAALYGTDDIAELNHEHTSPAVLEAAREQDQQEVPGQEPQEAVAEALEGVETGLAEMEGEITPEQARAILDARTTAEVASTGLLAPVESPIEEDYQEGVEEAREAVAGSKQEPEIVTKRGNIYERLMKDANHNLERRGYVSRYTGVEEIRQAMDEGGVKGRLLLNDYLNYLTIVLEIKERAG